MTAPSDRSGFALALAVCMLSAIACLAATSFLAVRESRRAATRFTKQEEAAAAADAGLFAILASWDAPALDSLAVGAVDSSTPATTLQFSGARPYVTRITHDLYAVTALGRSGNGTSVEARRLHSLLVTLVRPEVPAPAAIVSGGDIVVAQNAAISGADRPPPGWEDCPAADSGSATSVILPEGRAARYEGGHPIPDVRFDPVAADSATYRVFGPATLASLAARADITVRAGAMLSPHPAAADKCGSTRDIVSWGEPRHTVESPRCSRFFPLIHAEGDIVVTAGRGQGFLLVDGRLRIDGPFVFYGVILAARGIETRGDDVTVYGVTLSAGESGVSWAAAGQVQRSTCAVARAASAASRPLLIARRAWSELF